MAGNFGIPRQLRDDVINDGLHVARQGVGRICLRRPTTLLHASVDPLEQLIGPHRLRHDLADGAGALYLFGVPADGQDRRGALGSELRGQPIRQSPVGDHDVKCLVFELASRSRTLFA